MLYQLNTEHLFPRSLGHSRYSNPQNNDICWLILSSKTENQPKLAITIKLLSNAIFKTYLIKNLGLVFFPTDPKKNGNLVLEDK